MTRVLLLIKGLRPGGAERLLANAAPHLDRARFAYEVAYVLPDKDDLVATLEAAGLPVRCLGGRGGARRLRALVAGRAIDIVHAHSPSVAAVARLALAGTGVRHVYTEHAPWTSYRHATYWANALTFAANDQVLAVSDGVRSTIRYPRPLRRRRLPPVATAYPGAAPDSLPEAPDPGWRAELGVPDAAPVVGTVANFTPDKGHSQLIRAAARVRRAVPGVRFVLVGRGPLEGDARREVAQLGLEDTVVFAGYRADAPRLAAGFDVFALASVREGLGVALVEAMALGRPVVVTASGGPAEVVGHGEHGRVVAVGDADSMADRIVELLADRDLRDRLGAAAARRARDFDAAASVRRAESVYARLLA
jgi:glycosyltransferase involved in cell wall biosynthesis